MEEVGAMPVASEGPEERALAAVDRSALERAMWSLPEEQRVAITLVDLADLSVKETARVTNAPKGTVLSRLHRGRRTLALLLASEVREDRT
jgi:RNA polymerase sigma-70 factor (ECF subfamily)